MADVRWLSSDEARAWRSLQLMQMRLDGELARGSPPLMKRHPDGSLSPQIDRLSI